MVTTLGEHEGTRPDCWVRPLDSTCAADTTPPSASTKTRGDLMAETGETYTGSFYCVKCKEKRDATGDVVETNGRRMAKGKCPVCGTNLNRILGKA
jgi:hypothetical protein